MPVQRTPFDLGGKRAIVTGAGRGIGLAAALALGMAGAHVTLVATSLQEMEFAIGLIRQSGGEAESLALDITQLDALTNAIDASDPFDILVNNAGMNRPNGFLDVTADEYDSIMGLNVRAAYFVAQSVARRLVLASKGGSLINVSSQMGHVGALNRTVYCASKFAMEGFTKAMAVELGPRGIRVNTICPMFIETPMTTELVADQHFKESVLSKITLGRLGKPEDLMGAIIFLASEASSLLTGASLVIEGGWTVE